MPIINPNLVQSLVLKKRFVVSTGSALEDVVCPIDETPLVSVIEYDFCEYYCPACETAYQWGVKDQSELENMARLAAKEMQKKYDAGNILLREVPKYEQLIATAKEKGLL